MPNPFISVRGRRLAVLAACVLSSWMTATAWGQFQLPGFGKGLGSSGNDDPLSVTAQFTAANADRPAVLMITADIAPQWHIYSITQPPGGPQKTEIELTPSTSYRMLGPFRASPQPKSHIDDLAWVGLELQEHEGQVTWYAPIEIAEGVNPKKLTIDGTIRGQVCKTSCIPVNVAFNAKLGSGMPIGPLALDVDDAPASPTPLAGPTFVGRFQPDGSEVMLSGELVPGTVRPGQSAELVLSLVLPPQWHVYARAELDDKVGGKPTLIALEPMAELVAGQPKTNADVILQDQSEIGWGTARLHEGRVTWNTPLTVPANAAPGPRVIAGAIGYQACEGQVAGTGSCEVPQGARFQVTLTVGDQDGSASVPVTFAAAKYADVAKLASRQNGGPSEVASEQPGTATPSANAQGTRPLPPDQPPLASTSAYDLQRVAISETKSSIGHYLLLAFAGGLILNLMPCVLPVIGLKIMSFVEQAGQSRSRALVLNLWYAAGIVSVFVVLAGLAIAAGFTWGGQFGSTAFNVTIVSVVFAMALSLLGVWEIPIPGFFASGKAHELATQEGPMAAFLKGVVTTILATPCTGPFMGTALGWAVSQPTATTLAVFTSLGLGMASPYLLIGAFPELIRFVPKPGNWMVTFKQLMGFVLMGTVVFLLSFMDPAAVVPTLALLVGIGIACWVIARTSLTAAFRQQLEAWALGGAIVLLVAAVSFGWLYPEVTGPRFAARTATVQSSSTDSGRPWQPFSLSKLEQIAVREGRTVLVDFSAEWCLTCKALEKTVLHTKRVTEAIDESGVVTMYADFTNYPEEIDRTIKALGSNGVPVIAIFPGDAPYQPIVFRGAYSKDGLVSAIEQATGSPSGNHVIPATQISSAPAAELN